MLESLCWFSRACFFSHDGTALGDYVAMGNKMKLKNAICEGQSSADALTKLFLHFIDVKSNVPHLSDSYKASEFDNNISGQSKV